MVLIYRLDCPLVTGHHWSLCRCHGVAAANEIMSGGCEGSKDPWRRVQALHLNTGSSRQQGRRSLMSPPAARDGPHMRTHRKWSVQLRDTCSPSHHLSSVHFLCGGGQCCRLWLFDGPAPGPSPFTCPILHKTESVSVKSAATDVRRGRSSPGNCDSAEARGGRGRRGEGHSEAKCTSGGGGLTVTGCEVRRGGEGLGWACCCMVS